MKTARAYALDVLRAWRNTPGIDTLDNAVAAAIEARDDEHAKATSALQRERDELRDAIEAIRDHQDHDQYCDGCVFRKRMAEHALSGTRVARTGALK